MIYWFNWAGYFGYLSFCISLKQIISIKYARSTSRKDFRINVSLRWRLIGKRTPCPTNIFSFISQIPQHHAIEFGWKSFKRAFSQHNHSRYSTCQLYWTTKAPKRIRHFYTQIIQPSFRRLKTRTTKKVYHLFNCCLNNQ